MQKEKERKEETKRRRRRNIKWKGRLRESENTLEGEERRKKEGDRKNGEKEMTRKKNNIRRKGKEK